MKNEYICDDRTATPEYIQKIWDMTEEEFKQHLNDTEDQNDD